MPYKLGFYVGISAVLFLLSAAASSAQVLRVKDLDLNSRRDRGVLFEMAVTPANDVLSFVAQGSGDWELYRVGNWLGEMPSVKKLVLPGYFSKRDSKKGDKALENLSAHVFVTRDGAYAVCVGSAEWLKRVQGWAVGSATSSDIISVVELSTFKVVAITQTEGLDLFEFHGVVLDGDGYVRVESSSSGLKHGAFIRLSIPSLEAGPRCAYDEVVDSPGKQHSQPTNGSRCDETLRSKSLDDYLREGQTQPAQKPKVCESNSSEFCRVPGELTANGKFGVGFRSDGHDNIFGSWVTTSESIVVFSTSRGVDVSEITEPTNNTSKARLTSLAGIDYLVVIESGTHLMVYELRE